MSFVKQVMLLLLVALGANAMPEDCETINKTLTSKDISKISGNWVLVWSVFDITRGEDLLSNLSSSFVELEHRPQTNSIEFSERNLFKDKKCTRYVFNGSLPAEDATQYKITIDSATFERQGVYEHLNESGSVEFFQTCDGCMTMIYRGDIGNYLLGYRKDGEHNMDAEQKKVLHTDLRKLAECQSFPDSTPFLYDGEAEFCPKAADS